MVQGCRASKGHEVFHSWSIVCEFEPQLTQNIPLQVANTFDVLHLFRFATKQWDLNDLYFAINKCLWSTFIVCNFLCICCMRNRTKSLEYVGNGSPDPLDAVELYMASSSALNHDKISTQLRTRFAHLLILFLQDQSFSWISYFLINLFLKVMFSRNCIPSRSVANLVLKLKWIIKFSPMCGCTMCMFDIGVSKVDCRLEQVCQRVLLA